MTSFFVLGAMEIRNRNHVVRVTGTMKQTLVAAFVAAHNELITVDTLAEELWGTTPPAKMENALQAQISRIRRMLGGIEPDRQDPRLVTSVSGYRFSLAWTEVDAMSFLHTVDVIRSRPRVDLFRDIADLRSALSLWRGPVFGGLTGGPLCQTTATRYTEARTTAHELLFDLELRVGNHARIVPELTELFAQNPMREQFCSLLMVALYRSGRQIEALEVYRQLRRRLADELGIEPSPILRRFEKAILDHDPLLLLHEDLAAAQNQPAK